MTNSNKKTLILCVLAFLFLMPGIAALLFFKNPQWLSSSTLNKGSLLNPSLRYPHFKDNNHWRLLYVSTENCEDTCLHHVEKLARIRLALGRRLYQVDQYLVLDNSNAVLSKSLNQVFEKNQISVLLNSDTQLKSVLPEGKSAVFIVNPAQYLVLRYGREARSNDIFHDLQQLLTTGKKSV